MEGPPPDGRIGADMVRQAQAGRLARFRFHHQCCASIIVPRDWLLAHLHDTLPSGFDPHDRPLSPHVFRHAHVTPVCRGPSCRLARLGGDILRYRGVVR